MAKVASFVWSLGSDNIPLLFILVGAVMLSWLFFVGDMVLGSM